jgi:hypothetical protein
MCSIDWLWWSTGSFVVRRRMGKAKCEEVCVVNAIATNVLVWSDHLYCSIITSCT